MNLVRRAQQLVAAGLSLSDFDRVLDFLYSGEPTWTGKLVSQKNALGIGTVWACVDRIATDIARMPFQPFERDGDDNHLANWHYLYGLFQQEANPVMASFRFKYLMQTWVLLWGNAYAEMELNGRGQIVGLWPWFPDRTHVWRPEPGGPLAYTYKLRTGNQITIPQDRMFHLRGLSLDGLIGMSPVEVHKQHMALSMAMTEHSAKFFANGARPGGVLTHPQALSEKAKQSLQNSWDEVHRGVGNAHRIAILEEGLQYKEVGLKMVEAQFAEIAGMTDETIARIYQVPQHKIGLLDKATNNNIEQQSLEYIQSCIGGWTTNWSSEVEFAMLSLRDRQKIFTQFDLTPLILGDFQTMGNFIAMVTDRGVMNGDEVRRKYLGMNPQPDGIGRTYWKAVNMAPVPDALEAARLKNESLANPKQPEPAPQVAPILPPPNPKVPPKKQGYLNGAVS
jgi:HK97 family phage portal protein